jgi:rubrerythrin
MDVVRTLLSAIPIERSNSLVIYECRQCGETLEGATDACEYCSTSDVSTYRIE